MSDDSSAADVRAQLQQLVRAAARDAMRLGAQPEQCCPLRDYVRDVLFAPARGGHANPRTAEHELAMDATSLNSALHDAGGGRVPLAAIARAPATRARARTSRAGFICSCRPRCCTPTSTSDARRPETRQVAPVICAQSTTPGFIYYVYEVILD